MTTAGRSKTKLQSVMKKLFPANTLARKMASQLKRRIKDPSVDYRLYRAAYKEVNPPGIPRTPKDKLRTVFWIVVIIFSYLVALYFGLHGYTFPG